MEKIKARRTAVGHIKRGVKFTRGIAVTDTSKPTIYNWFIAHNPLENWDKRMKWICFGFTLISTIILIS